MEGDGTILKAALFQHQITPARLIHLLILPLPPHLFLLALLAFLVTYPTLLSPTSLPVRRTLPTETRSCTEVEARARNGRKKRVERKRRGRRSRGDHYRVFVGRDLRADEGAVR